MENRVTSADEGPPQGGGSRATDTHIALRNDRDLKHRLLNALSTSSEACSTSGSENARGANSNSDSLSDTDSGLDSVSGTDSDPSDSSEEDGDANEFPTIIGRAMSAAPPQSEAGNIANADCRAEMRDRRGSRASSACVSEYALTTHREEDTGRGFAPRGSLADQVSPMMASPPATSGHLERKHAASFSLSQLYFWRGALVKSAIPILPNQTSVTLKNGQQIRVLNSDIFRGLYDVSGHISHFGRCTQLETLGDADHELECLPPGVATFFQDVHISSEYAGTTFIAGSFPNADKSVGYKCVSPLQTLAPRTRVHTERRLKNAQSPDSSTSTTNLRVFFERRGHFLFTFAPKQLPSPESPSIYVAPLFAVQNRAQRTAVLVDRNGDVDGLRTRSGDVVAIGDRFAPARLSVLPSSDVTGPAVQVCQICEDEEGEISVTDINGVRRPYSPALLRCTLSPLGKPLSSTFPAPRQNDRTHVPEGHGKRAGRAVGSKRPGVNDGAPGAPETGDECQSWSRSESWRPVKGSFAMRRPSQHSSEPLHRLSDFKTASLMTAHVKRGANAPVEPRTSGNFGPATHQAMGPWRSEKYLLTPSGRALLVSTSRCGSKVELPDGSAHRTANVADMLVTVDYDLRGFPIRTLFNASNRSVGWIPATEGLAVKIQDFVTHPSLMFPTPIAANQESLNLADGSTLPICEGNLSTLYFAASGEVLYSVTVDSDGVARKVRAAPLRGSFASRAKYFHTAPGDDGSADLLVVEVDGLARQVKHPEVAEATIAVNRDALACVYIGADGEKLYSQLPDGTLVFGGLADSEFDETEADADDLESRRAGSIMAAGRSRPSCRIVTGSTCRRSEVRQEIIERQVAVPEIEFVEKLVEVPEVHMVEKRVEFEQVEWQTRVVRNRQVVERPVEHIRYVPKIEIRKVERIIEIPEIIQVEKEEIIEQKKRVDVFVDTEQSVCVAQQYRPKITETNLVSHPVACTRVEPELVYIDIYVPKLVYKTLLATSHTTITSTPLTNSNVSSNANANASGKEECGTSSRASTGCSDAEGKLPTVSVPHYNSLVVAMNRNLADDYDRLPVVKAKNGSIPLLPKEAAISLPEQPAEQLAAVLEAFGLLHRALEPQEEDHLRLDA